MRRGCLGYFIDPFNVLLDNQESLIEAGAALSRPASGEKPRRRAASCIGVHVRSSFPPPSGFLRIRNVARI
jgi:hypothetical protein